MTDGIAEHRKGVQELNADRLGNPVFCRIALFSCKIPKIWYDKDNFLT